MSLHAPTKKTAELAHLHVPDFLTWDHVELHILTNVLRDGNATQVYLALREYSDFVTGEFNGGYHNLMALCTPPRPERAASRPGPSYQAVRRIIEDLIKVGLVQRPDPTNNALQGQLRLQLTHVFRKAAPVELNNRSANRVAKGRKSRKSTTCDDSRDESQQECQQGFQGVNTPLIPQTAGVIHSPATPQSKAEAKRVADQVKAELKERLAKKNINRPRNKATKAPAGPVSAPTSFSSIADLLPSQAAPGE